jgi:hypothetical protein
MDLDMHYYGTFALARAAGLDEPIAHRIAMAAEFVDDSTATEVVVHPDGARFRSESTAHHPSDLPKNDDLDDQQLVWVPFHFLPGADGATQSQRLICRKNSPVAQAMVKHHIENWHDQPYAIELIGITAHVFADTFAHFGFSGVSSRANRVKSDSFKLINGDPLAGKIDGFFKKFGIQGGLIENFRRSVMSEAAEDVTGALGHGAVVTFPDQPYLEWSYQYEMPAVAGTKDVERQNANDFEEGARQLHIIFQAFAKIRSEFADGTGGVDFETIRPTIREIVRLVGPREERIAAWKTAASDGKFTRGRPFSLTDYDHTAWRKQTQELAKLEKPELASAVPAYHFHHAAMMHRSYVLRELLPAYGIYII